MRPINFRGRAKLLALLCFGVVAANLAYSKDDPTATPSSRQRLREGTRLMDVPGRFEAVGDQVNFVFGESGESMRVLENLSLQRVSRVLGQTQDSTQWTVCGTITEYNNTNYLFLTKAVQAGKSVAKESAAAGGIVTRAKVDYPNSREKKSGDKNQESTHDRHP